MKEILNCKNELVQIIQPTLLNDFIQFIDRGKQTTRTYLNNLKQFLAWLNNEGITDPTRREILLYREYLENKHKPNTAKIYFQSVKHFFKWTASVGVYPNIASDIRPPKSNQKTHLKEALTPSDVLKIEHSITLNAERKIANATNSKKDTVGKIDRATEQGKRLYAMYLLAVNCGLRTIELHRANIKDIETINGISYLRVWGKGHAEADEKEVLVPEIMQAIKDYLDIRTDNKTGESPLFTSTGNRSKGKRIATTTISTMLKRAMQEAGYNSERITAHSLRHTTGTNVQEVTKDIYLTQQYMRHKNPATTEIYLHNNVDREKVITARKLFNLYHTEKHEENEQFLSFYNAQTDNEQRKKCFLKAE